MTGTHVIGLVLLAAVCTPLVSLWIRRAVVAHENARRAERVQRAQERAPVLFTCQCGTHYHREAWWHDQERCQPLREKL